MTQASIGLLVALACAGSSMDAKVYQVRYLPTARIRIDGRLQEPAWGAAHAEQGFAFPWTRAAAPATEFRALMDDQNLYFSFRVRDADLVLAQDYRGKGDVVKEDRVELFFALDDKLAEYYCLEMDPRGRTLDYKAAYYRKFDNSWSAPGLEVAAMVAEGEYMVEGSLPLRTFEALGFPLPGAGKTWRVGVFRAEFSHGPAGETVEDWISWVDPGTEKPDFHVPAAFGLFRFTGP